jgi:hypothetical protein
VGRALRHRGTRSASGAVSSSRVQAGRRKFGASTIKLVALYAAFELRKTVRAIAAELGPSGGDDPPTSADGGGARALDSMYADSTDDSGDDTPPDPPDNGGMADDGSLDDATQEVLLDAHGC